MLKKKSYKKKKKKKKGATQGPVHKYLWDIYAMNYTILFVKTVFFLSIKWLFPSVHCWVHFHDIV
jgi:hypothetical protein